MFPSLESSLGLGDFHNSTKLVTTEISMVNDSTDCHWTVFPPHLNCAKNNKNKLTVTINH